MSKPERVIASPQAASVTIRRDRARDQPLRQQLPRARERSAREFSNALAPGVCGAALAAIEIAQSEEGETRRRQLAANTAQFRSKLTDAGFELRDGGHPIVPVMLGDAALTQRMAAALLDRGVLATGFSFPVVPRGAARIRAQLSAAHSQNDLDCAVDAFVGAGRALGVIATTDHGR